MTRAAVIKKIEALMSDAAATPGEKAAARARLDAIRNKRRDMSDEDLAATIKMLAAQVMPISRLMELKKELKLYRAERRKRYRKKLKAMTDGEVAAELRATKHPDANDEDVRRVKRRLRRMTNAELAAMAAAPQSWRDDIFIKAEVERRRRRRR